MKIKEMVNKNLLNLNGLLVLWVSIDMVLLRGFH